MVPSTSVRVDQWKYIGTCSKVFVYNIVQHEFFYPSNELTRLRQTNSVGDQFRLSLKRLLAKAESLSQDK